MAASLLDPAHQYIDMSFLPSKKKKKKVFPQLPATWNICLLLFSKFLSTASQFKEKPQWYTMAYGSLQDLPAPPFCRCSNFNFDNSPLFISFLSQCSLASSWTCQVPSCLMFMHLQFFLLGTFLLQMSSGLLLQPAVSSNVTFSMLLPVITLLKW